MLLTGVLRVRGALARCLLLMAMFMAVGAPISGCSRHGQPPSEKKHEPVTVALPLGLAGALVILASERRYFSEQGLDVTLRRVATSASALDAVDRGEADLGMSSDTPFVFAVLEKKNVRLLARVFRARTFVSIVARKDHGIARPGDLAGKRIGVVPDTAADYFLELYLAFQGIETTGITRVPLGADQIEQAVIDGSVDAVSIWHPYSSRAMTRLGPRAVMFNDPAVYQMRFNLVERADLASRRPDVARSFLTALQSAHALVRDHPDQARSLIAKAVNEDPALLRSVWGGCDYTLALDQTLLGGLESEARWALNKRKTARTTPPNFLEFIDARPLLDVQRDAVSVLLP